MKKIAPDTLPDFPASRHRLLVLTGTALLAMVLACGSPSPDADAATPERAAEEWQCRNDLEVRCGDGTCEAETGDGFTPMSVTVDDSGAMSVCAYSGCWEGTGEALQSQEFLVVIGHDLKFSTARDSDSAAADIAILIDRADGVATLKAGAFTHPLLCESL